MTSEQRIDVPQPLGAAQVDRYVEDGYLVIDDALSSADLDRLKAEIVRFARGTYPIREFTPLGEDASDDEAMQGILRIQQPHWVSPEMLEFARHPIVCGALSQLAGAHLPSWDGSVKCMQTMVFVKPPGMPGQAWHQDERHIPTRDRSLIAAWVAIDQATVDNGGLWVIPGSHQTGYLYPTRDHDDPEEFDASDECYGFDDSPAVPVEVAPGSVVFFNGYLLHRSLRNRSDIYRRAFVAHYCNAWSLLPWFMYDDLHFATADRRMIVPVAGIDPYAWKGYDKAPKEVFMKAFKRND